MTAAELPGVAPDVLVVGAGNAALCAGISAHQNGARVLMLEAAPFEERGGNSHFTGGAFRFAFAGVDDLLAVLPSLAQERLENVDFGTYTQDQFFDDLFALTQYRSDPDLLEILVRGSLDTAKWIAQQGVKLQPGLGRQAYQVDGKFKFWGGLALHIWGGGPELLNALYANVERRGIPILYETPATSLIRENGRLAGVIAEHQGAPVAIRAGAVVLACGSFESNPEMRAKYLGPGWEMARVRGTRFNMGAGLNMAMAIGARPYGHWSGSHSVAWDINAPPYGDLTVGDQFQKHNYPFGILINAKGERYVDEGANFHSHTYAKYGGEIIKLPGMFAWQVFDAKVSHLLRSEYRIRRVTKAEANTLEELAGKLDGVDPEGFLRTVREFNAACRVDTPFNPNVLDGRRTQGLAINKTNWANPLDTPPFHAYHVTTGVTFTFGGLKISQKGEVEDLYGRIIPGLYAAGEMVGGLFFHNYASGTGLMSGATFGRLAGRSAAAFTRPPASRAAQVRHDAEGAAPRSCPMTMATELAQRIRAFTYDGLPGAALEWAKTGILDTVGVTLAGSAEPCAQIMLRVCTATGPALVFGSAQRLSVTDAALVNGTASHALDFDDCSNTLGGHPSAPILPGLFALADAMPVSGRDFLAAYVAGFETETRIARAVNFHHYDKGWHPTATLGIFGATAAASRLLELTQDQTATALAIAASFSSGLKANFGTMTKPLHVGHCARNGVMAAMLARAGMTASHDVFEHRQGFFNVFNGAGNYDADAVLRDWAEPLDIITPGIAIKSYPCCGSTHPAIDAMLDLVRAHRLTPENVAHVVSWTHPRRLAHTNRPSLRSALDAKFSVQYCLARALVDGQVVLSHFNDDAYLDARVADVMARIEAAPHPQMSSAGTAHFGAEVTVTTTDGRRLVKVVDGALGRTSEQPLPRFALEAKYRDCAGRVLTPDAVDRSLDLVADMETLDRASVLADTLAAGCACDQAGGPAALARAS